MIKVRSWRERKSARLFDQLASFLQRRTYRFRKHKDLYSLHRKSCCLSNSIFPVSLTCLLHRIHNTFQSDVGNFAGDLQWKKKKNRKKEPLQLHPKEYLLSLFHTSTEENTINYMLDYILLHFGSATCIKENIFIRLFFTQAYPHKNVHFKIILKSFTHTGEKTMCKLL